MHVWWAKYGTGICNYAKKSNPLGKDNRMKKNTDCYYFIYYFKIVLYDCINSCPIFIRNVKHFWHLMGMNLLGNRLIRMNENDYLKKKKILNQNYQFLHFALALGYCSSLKTVFSAFNFKTVIRKTSKCLKSKWNLVYFLNFYLI